MIANGEKKTVNSPFFGMEKEFMRYKAWFKCDYDYPEYKGRLKGRMFPVTGLHFFEGRELTSISIDTEEYGEIQNLRLEADKIVIIRYTGYKDSKGKLIYENDVVKIRDLYYMVKWDFGQWELYCVKKDVWSNPYFHSWIGESVKVGNIFENPEFLGRDYDKEQLKITEDHW